MEDKKAFVVYTNWKQYIDDLTDEQVGMWTRWMFDYCTDKWLDKEIEYPKDAAVKVLCKLTKDILKKDLAKYKDKRKRIEEINERKRNKVETSSKQSENEIDHEIVHDIENEIDHSNKLSVISNKLLDNSKELINNIESKDSSAVISPEELSKAVIVLPCVGNYQHPVFEEDINHYKDLYPAVDILQELKKMLGWLESNPQNKKTKAGIKSFITRWLSKCQDKAPKVETFYSNNSRYANNGGFESLDDDPTTSFGGVEKL